jgi:hypothetical protein
LITGRVAGVIFGAGIRAYTVDGPRTATVVIARFRSSPSRQPALRFLGLAVLRSPRLLPVVIITALAGQSVTEYWLAVASVGVKLIGWRGFRVSAVGLNTPSRVPGNAELVRWRAGLYPTRTALAASLAFHIIGSCRWASFLCSMAKVLRVSERKLIFS